MPGKDTPSRGRPPRAVPMEATGYRCTAEVRRQLQLALAFTGETALQGVIDRAVTDYLATMRANVEGFADAVEAADRHLSGAPKNVSRIARRRS